MKEHNRLVRSLQGIDQVLELLKDNSNATFINHHLMCVKTELKSQLTNLSNSSTIKE